MSIPPRLQLEVPSPHLVSHMCELCDAIERAVEQGDDAGPLLAQWHEHATSSFEPSDFTSYWKSIDQESFVLGALYPRPSLVPELQYHEAAAVLDCVTRAELSEAEMGYYLNWLQVQFPNSNFSDLVFWPDEWFGDASLFRDANGAFKPDAELSLDQTLTYAMLRSGRKLPGAPEDITLPYPLPDTQ